MHFIKNKITSQREFVRRRCTLLNKIVFSTLEKLPRKLYDDSCNTQIEHEDFQSFFLSNMV